MESGDRAEELGRYGVDVSKAEWRRMDGRFGNRVRTTGAIRRERDSVMLATPSFHVTSVILNSAIRFFFFFPLDVQCPVNLLSFLK